MDWRRFFLSLLVLAAGFFMGVGIWATVVGTSGTCSDNCFMATPYSLGLIVGLLSWLTYEIVCPISFAGMRMFTRRAAAVHATRI